MATVEIEVPWDQVKAKDLINHPWPKYPVDVGAKVKVNDVKINGNSVDIMTNVGGGTFPKDGKVVVIREE